MEAITDFNLRLTDIAFRNLLVHSLIMLKRFEKKRHVKYDEEEIELFSGTKEFRCAQQIITEISGKLGISLGDEVYYLTQHLISSQRFLIENLDGDYEYKEEIEEYLKYHPIGDRNRSVRRQSADQRAGHAFERGSAEAPV